MNARNAWFVGHPCQIKPVMNEEKIANYKVLWPLPRYLSGNNEQMLLSKRL
ncbi:MAG: hypothetical protein KGP14_03475 [Betaproteobacteria bacterium]|nr:hypothetical protein [Betaproteobacteria bacterium]